MVREETLDPENWEEMRELGHKMLDDMIDFQQESASRNYMSLGTPEAVKELLIPLPDEGEGECKVFEIYQKNIKPFHGVSLSPRFWGGCSWLRLHIWNACRHADLWIKRSIRGTPVHRRPYT
ncbi:hypothetical protein KEJ21_04525 [Candidatus Bathyarchaeota archaeon]|nr:hypothetical protein [Candidatus Bathyarchaeota archaeon]MBS7631008.1 hypothetical protein [Candidatus Bathyarchaeota archaeon]